MAYGGVPRKEEVRVLKGEKWQRRGSPIGSVGRKLRFD